MAGPGPVPPPPPPAPPTQKLPPSATGTKPYVVGWDRVQLRVGQLEDGISEMEKTAVERQLDQEGRLRLLRGRLLDGRL